MREDPTLIPSLCFKDKRGELIKPPLEINGKSKLEFKDIYVSISKKNVFRGLHYQLHPFQQEKFFTAISGSFIVYCIDVSKEFSVKEFRLNQESSQSLYVPKGWATGLLALCENNIILYCSPQAYSPEYQKGIHYSKIPRLNELELIISDADAIEKT